MESTHSMVQDHCGHYMWMKLETEVEAYQAWLYHLTDSRIYFPVSAHWQDKNISNIYWLNVCYSHSDNMQ